jgi:MoaA/NifB/PqqE/SkfB family radical SAM enzyme
MTLDTLNNIAHQADELGLAQFNISGGEPLFFKNIYDIIKALIPQKFHLAMSTNGMFLDVDMAKRLKETGLDKIRISIDNINEDAHNANRNQTGAQKKALEALKIAKEANLDAVILNVVTHQSVHSKELIDLLEYATDNDYIVDLLPARALGEWEGRYDVLIDEDDAALLRELHKKYPVARWDMFPRYELSTVSCGTVDSTLHISKYGEVQPCAYIQISIGNIFDDNLRDIIQRGFNIKYFRNFSPKCLSGEDRNFILKYMSKCNNRPVPVSYKEIFSEDDYIDPSKI